MRHLHRPVHAAPLLIAITTGIAAMAPCLAGLPTADPAEVVKLPEFVVKADLPWKYAEYRGLEIVSLASNTATSQFVLELTFQIESIKTLFPKGFLQNPGPNALLILHTYDGAPGERDISSPEAGVIRRWLGHARDNYAGATLSDRVDYDTPTYTINLSWFESHNLQAKRPILFTTNKHLRWLLDCRRPSPPEWLKVGLQIAFKQAAFTDASFTLATSEHLAVMRGRDDGRLPNLAALVEPGGEALDPLAFPGTAKVPNSVVDAAQFVIWGLRSKEHSALFWTFVRRASEQNVNEDLFKECFGFGYRQAERRIAAFFPRANNFCRIDLPEHLSKAQPPLDLRPALPGELGRIVGEWRRQTAFLEEDPVRFAAAIEHARTSIMKTLPRKEDPRILATLGICERDAGKNEEALMHLQAAVRAKIVRPRAYLDFARLLFERATAGLKDPAAKLDEGQTKAILEPLRAGAMQTPALNGTYRLAADVWMRSAVEPASEDLAFVEEGTRLFPRDSQLAIAAIRLHAKHGLKGEAATIANRWLKTTDEKTRMQFEAAGFKPGS